MSPSHTKAHADLRNRNKIIGRIEVELIETGDGGSVVAYKVLGKDGADISPVDEQWLPIQRYGRVDARDAMYIIASHWLEKINASPTKEAPRGSRFNAKKPLEDDEEILFFMRLYRYELKKALEAMSSRSLYLERVFGWDEDEEQKHH